MTSLVNLFCSNIHLLKSKMLLLMSDVYFSCGSEMAFELLFIYLRLMQNTIPSCFICKICAEYNLFFTEPHSPSIQKMGLNILNIGVLV